MSERIKELAEQVYGSAHYDDFKFAELIISETCRLLAENKEFRAAVLVGRHFPLWK
jgi:hypothetical protein